jgi:hypothetical protein
MSGHDRPSIQKSYRRHKDIKVFTLYAYVKGHGTYKPFYKVSYERKEVEWSVRNYYSLGPTVWVIRSKEGYEGSLEDYNKIANNRLQRGD